MTAFSHLVRVFGNTRFAHRCLWAVGLFACVVVVCVPASLKARVSDILSPLVRLEGRGMRIGAFFTLGDKTLLSHRPDEALNPASVTKVFAAAAALAILGPDATIETQVVALGRGEGPQVLAVVGGGDPMLTADDLRSMAACIHEAGVLGVSRLLVDNGPFNDDFMPPAFDRKNTDAPYRAGIGGLQVNYNRVMVSILAGKRGAPPEVRLDPPSAFFEVRNEATTASPDDQKRRKASLLDVALLTGVNQAPVLRVKGTLKPRGRVVLFKMVPNPAIHAGFVFRRALEDAGVRVESGPDFGDAPEGARLLCRHRSPTLREMLVPMLKESQNQVAESLFRLCGAAKSRGRPVGFEEGALALRAFLTNEVGLKPEEARFTNGSGLYDANEVSARATVRMLEYIRQKPELEAIIAALPVAGVDGTLKNRLKPLRGRVSAKTGTLDGVVSLAGYMNLDDGRTVTFALLVEGPGKVPSAIVRKAMDDALVGLWNHLTRKTKKGSRSGK